MEHQRPLRETATQPAQSDDPTVAVRGSTIDAEAQILAIIRDMVALDGRTTLSVKEIASWFSERHEESYLRKITPKWIGWLIRRRLGIFTHKSNGVYVISRLDEAKLKRLFRKYGVEAARRDETSESS